MFKKIFGTLLLSILSIASAYSQISLIKDETPSKQIVGTWISERGFFNNRWVFKKNNKMDRYYENKIYKTFNWTIEETQIPSELTHRELILTNINDSNDVYKYLIDALTEKRLVLVYNTGIGLSRNAYIRQ